MNLYHIHVRYLDQLEFWGMIFLVSIYCCYINQLQITTHIMQFASDQTQFFLVICLRHCSQSKENICFMSPGILWTELIFFPNYIAYIERTRLQASATCKQETTTDYQVTGVKCRATAANNFFISPSSIWTDTKSSVGTAQNEQQISLPNYIAYIQRKICSHSFCWHCWHISKRENQFTSPRVALFHMSYL